MPPFHCAGCVRVPRCLPVLLAAGAAWQRSGCKCRTGCEKSTTVVNIRPASNARSCISCAMGCASSSRRVLRGGGPVANAGPGARSRPLRLTSVPPVTRGPAFRARGVRDGRGAARVREGCVMGAARRAARRGECSAVLHYVRDGGARRGTATRAEMGWMRRGAVHCTHKCPASHPTASAQEPAKFPSCSPGHGRTP